MNLHCIKSGYICVQNKGTYMNSVYPNKMLQNTLMRDGCDVLKHDIYGLIPLVLYEPIGEKSWSDTTLFACWVIFHAFVVL